MGQLRLIEVLYFGLNMDQLIKQQQDQGESISKFITNTNKTGKANQTPGFFQARIQLLNKYWNTFSDNHRNIVKHPEAKEAAKYISDEYFDEIEVVYADTLGFLLDAVTPTQQAPGPDHEGLAEVHVPQQRHENVHIKLPPIAIPKFSGDYSTWTSFFDLFDALVVKNPTLSNVNKLHHLKASLSGEAELVLRKYAIEDRNFEPAWKHLQGRFDNKRLLVNSHFAKLLLQQKVSSSAAAIRHLHDVSSEAITSIQSLLDDNLQFSSLLIYILTQKLDKHTVQAWEESIQDDEEFPELDDFFTFLEGHCRTQDLVQSSTKSVDGHSNYNKGNIEYRRSLKALHTSNAPASCAFCQKPKHSVFKCYKFKALNPMERHKIAQTKNWCTRCLTSEHQTNGCTKTWLCPKCNGAHNVLLHQPNAEASSSNTASQNNNASNSAIMETISQPDATVHAYHVSSFYKSKTLLGTAQVLISSSCGQVLKFRALIDPGSDSCLISRNAVALLKLPLQKYNTHVKALGGTSVAKSNHVVSFVIHSIHDFNITMSIDAVIMPTLTNTRPPEILQSMNWAHLEQLPLADPNYYQADKIDLIVGADTYYDLFMNDIRKGPRGSPIAQQTCLGYVLIGQIWNQQTTSALQSYREIRTHFIESSKCDDQLRKFWELEELPDVRNPTKDEQFCEEHYQRTHYRKSNGRYVVELPFNTIDGKPPIFGNSKTQALSRLHQVERRLKNSSNLNIQYNEFMDEYLKLGHMHAAKNVHNLLSCYLPHHAIIKQEHSSTKLRVVFDASAKDSSGQSLNSSLHVGPTIQQDLLSILLRWRKHKFAIIADAEKMYRQIEVSPQHRSYQRILWRDINGGIIDYELATVTYGTACAPFLAIRTIHQLSIDEQLNFPVAAERTRNDMYVDDFISGCDTIEQAQNLQHDMVELFKKGGFNLRKWASNSSTILDNIPSKNREAGTCLEICRDDVIKTLGVFWNTVVDEYHFVVKLSDQPRHLSKRELLSDISKLFDPMGFLAPVVILAKILFQSLWLKGLDWDDPLPEDIVHEWLNLRSNLREIASIKIPRWIGTTSISDNIQFHGFCDASLKAYAAVIYCRTKNHDGQLHVHLLTSKTRVAPIKKISLPNLELCGATLLAKLMTKVRTAMDINAEIFTWTDSTIVLDWIRNNTHKQTFVANRISTILDHLKPAQWRHVRSKDNPADVASRGICPSQLQEHNLWWHGPLWLQQTQDEWPKIGIRTDDIVSECNTEILAATTLVDHDFSATIERFSSIDKLVRVIALCTLFARKCRPKSLPNNNTYPTATDYRNSLHLLIKCVQTSSYSQETRQLSASTPLANSKISSLNPFICAEGFIRVGGRLQNANISYDQKYPILLPHEHHLTKLLITKIHLDTLHGGIKLTLSTLRQNYWVPNARTAIRSIIHKCVKCHRYAIQVKQQLMSALPSPRVNQARVFAHSGVDYAGPFDLRLSKHRGRGTYKGYVAVFVCLATKAIHLELASDLTTKTFLAAFKRFTSRRGPCSDIYSDNGTNFVGANRELKSMFDESMSQLSTTASEMLAIKGTTWHFIPAHSPHFGGLWEAAVKAFKYHLKRIVDQSVLTYEEFYTLLTEIEASLNSRPLCQMSSDPNDTEAITPGHFLVGCALNSLPEPSIIDVHESRLHRWQLITKMHQDFWQSWSKDYLCELQQRPKKWQTERENLVVGDLVIMKDDRVPPSNWNLARIIETHPGSDGIVRVVTLKHKSGETKRAINKVCKLPIDDKKPESLPKSNASSLK